MKIDAVQSGKVETSKRNTREVDEPMDRPEFFNADGTINMTKALSAGRRARAEAARSGVVDTMRTVTQPHRRSGFLSFFF